jgi:hypothetical protein
MLFYACSYCLERGHRGAILFILASCIFDVLQKNRLIIFCFAVLITSILVNPYFLYFSTINNLNFLMMGCLGALFYDKYQIAVNNSFIKESKWLWLAIVMMCVTMLITKNYLESETWKLTLLPLFYLYFVLYTVVNTDGKKPIAS